MASILVIDDDELMRQMLRDMLQGAGHTMIEAASGDDGLVWFGRERFDIVITDLFMPPKGGLEVIKELKAADSEVRVIAISGVQLSGTGYRHDEDPKRLAIEAGALRTFSKPFSQEDMLAAIEEILDE